MPRGLVDRQPLPVVSAILNPMLPTPSSRKRSFKVSESSVFMCDNSFAHFELKGDGYASGVSRTPTFGRVMSGLHRRDTTAQTLYADPSSKIWGLYLSQAEKFDKEHSKSWTANTEGVLVFVRHNLSHGIVQFLPRGLIRPVFSPSWWPHSSLSVIRCYSPIQLISPINYLPDNLIYQQMGRARHSHSLLLILHHSDLALQPCV